MRGRIRFLLGDTVHEIAGIDPTTTVLGYLREIARRPGTKEGCAEGDCGACTVVLGGLENGRLTYRAVNACILLVGALDGKELLTVEDLAEGEALHPVQAAMVASHGSQCGFCTPGIVMALYALYHHGPPSDAAIAEALAGNLCRCTGYGPVIEAAKAMHAIAPADRFAARAAETAARLAALADEETLVVEGNGRRWTAPAEAGEFAAAVAADPEAAIIAGATDAGLWVTKQHRPPARMIAIERVAALKRVCVDDEAIEIGAGAPYAAAVPVLCTHYPALSEMFGRLGSVQIRNVGTIGGNIANGSPIGDSPPALIALGARLILRRGRARREIALEDYFLAYGRQDRRPGEFVEAVRVPLPRPGQEVRCYKVAKRHDQDISAVLGAFNLTIEKGRVSEARVAFGGMAATPKRARACEKALTGAPWSARTVARAQAALARDFSPIDDLRAGARYRARVAANLVTRLHLETSAPETLTRVDDDAVLADA